jgi:hypothetical protein
MSEKKQLQHSNKNGKFNVLIKWENNNNNNNNNIIIIIISNSEFQLMINCHK